MLEEQNPFGLIRSVAFCGIMSISDIRGIENAGKDEVVSCFLITCCIAGACLVTLS